jgi:hypothetical protein
MFSPKELQWIPLLVGPGHDFPNIVTENAASFTTPFLLSSVAKKKPRYDGRYFMNINPVGESMVMELNYFEMSC